MRAIPYEQGVRIDRPTWNKPYVDVTHDTGEILEAKQLFIYAIRLPRGSQRQYARDLNKVSTYYFSAGADGQVFELTVNNLKQAYPANHRCHDSLDQTFALGGVEQFDEFHKMFKVSRLLMAAQTR